MADGRKMANSRWMQIAGQQNGEADKREVF